MGGEDQLKAIIRQGFALQNTADKTVLQVDQVLAQAMSNVKQLVGSLPEESLLRGRAWKDLQPLVQQELNVYGQQLGSAIENALVDAEPEMERAAIRQAKLGGADFGPETISINPAGGRVQNTVEMALNSRVNNVTVKRLFNIDGKTKTAAIDKSLFRLVDTEVRAGMINGTPTDEIARSMIGEVTRAGIPGVDINSGKVSKRIRSQANAIARTATQDMARQVKQEVYDANADAMEGMEWQWTTALDSRTCETCSPLDGRRWKDQKDVPEWPLHPNCRCQSLPIDPEDPFWDNSEVTAQVIRPFEKGAYDLSKGGYKTPVKINGKKFYRQAVTVTSDAPPTRYSDVLARWATSSQTSLEEALGPTRARWFKKEYDRLNKDPQQILQAMLTGKPGAQKFIPIEKLLTKEVKLPAKRVVKKAAPKPKFKVVAKPVAPKQAQLKAQAVIKKAKATLQPPAPVTVAPKPAIDIAKAFDDSKNSLGRGLFGEARLVDSGVTKRGWLSKNEIDALEALKDSGVTPKPLGVSFVDKEWNTTLYKGMKVRKGYLAMDKAPGETIGKILDFGGGFTERQARDVTDSLLRARKKFHLKGVAHQDMHGNNVLYDLKSKQMTIIDLGTARMDARAALVEALGTNRGRMSFGQVEAPGDYQSRPTFTLLNKSSRLADNPVWKRFNANRRAVEAKLKREGAGSILDSSIRKLPRDVTKNLSPARALELLEELYEGI